MEPHRKNYNNEKGKPAASVVYEEKNGYIECKISIFKLNVGTLIFPKESVNIVLTHETPPSRYSRRLLGPYGIMGEYGLTVQKQYVNVPNDIFFELQEDVARFDRRIPIPDIMAVEIIENMMKVCGSVHFHIVNPERREPQIPAKRQKIEKSEKSENPDDSAK